MERVMSENTVYWLFVWLGNCSVTGPITRLDCIFKSQARRLFIVVHAEHDSLRAEHLLLKKSGW